MTQKAVNAQKIRIGFALQILAAICFLAAVLLPPTACASSALTYAVGKCAAPSIPNYPTISAALQATPPAAVIEVCPGTYNEQLAITSSVTIKGLNSGDLGGVVIAAPINGFLPNGTDISGSPLNAQIAVSNAPGPVVLQNLVIDGSTSFSCSQSVVGILFQNSSGTINEVATRNQNYTCGGYGIWIQGGNANPVPNVTVTKSSIHDFSNVGILANTVSIGTPLTVAIENNEISAPPPAGGIILAGGVSATVSGNTVSGGEISLQFGPTGTISSNIVMNTTTGIEVAGDGITVKSNKVFNTQTAIMVENENGVSTGTTVVQSNTINNAAIAAIDFGCLPDHNIHSNVITEAGIGLNNVPNGIGGVNTFFGVVALRSGC